MYSAAGGFLAWGLVALATTVGRTSLGAIEVLFLLSPLVAVPLGMGIARGGGGPSTPLQGLARALQPLGAVMAVASFMLPAGSTAAWCAAGWALVCALGAIDGLWRLVRGGSRSAEGVCFGLSFVYLFVGAVWLVLSRRGATPFDLPGRTVLLAAVHFHFTGFALPMVAGATGRALRRRGGSPVPALLLPWVAAGILLGPALLAAGNIRQVPTLKLVGALLLVVVSIGLAGLLASVLGAVSSTLARALLAISVLSLVLGMALVAVYTLGEFLASDWLLVPEMARLHGTINALGFASLGLLGWSLEQRQLARAIRGP